MSEKIVQLNEAVIKSELKELVRVSVEETLNELLEAEAEKLTQAARYERNEQRQGYRSGHYHRSLTTASGDVTLKVPKLKGTSFETAIIERYRRRESSVEEALIEMYLAGVSVRRVEDITEALWGRKVSPATISELNKKAYVHIEDLFCERGALHRHELLRSDEQSHFGLYQTTRLICVACRPKNRRRLFREPPPVSIAAQKPVQ